MPPPPSQPPTHHPVSQAVPPPSQPAAPPPTHHPVSQPASCSTTQSTSCPSTQSTVYAVSPSPIQPIRSRYYVVWEWDPSIAEDKQIWIPVAVMMMVTAKVMMPWVQNEWIRYVMLVSSSRVSGMWSWLHNVQPHIPTVLLRVDISASKDGSWYDSQEFVGTKETVWTIKYLETCFWATWYSSDRNGSEMVCFSTQTVDKTIGWCTYIST